MAASRGVLATRSVAARPSHNGRKCQRIFERMRVKRKVGMQDVSLKVQDREATCQLLVSFRKHAVT
jgi:hypothetical protein